MATIKPLSVSAKRLAQTIVGSAMAFKLDNILTWDGVTDLAAADFGTKAYAAFRNSAGTLVEFMEIDPATIANTSITILRRGLKYNGDDLTTEVSANKLTWVKGDTIVELGTHLPQLLAHFVTIVGDQSIAGVKTFSSFPLLPAGSPSAAQEAASKAYVDLVAGGSANYDQNIIPGVLGESITAGDVVYFKAADQRWWLADADLTATFDELQLGISQTTGIAAAAANILIAGVDKNQSGLTAGSSYFLSGTAGGRVTPTPSGKVSVFIGRAHTATRLIVNFRQIDMVQKVQHIAGGLTYGASAAGTDTYAITLSPAPLAYVAGMKFTFKADVANTGAATLNVNSLGAIAIKKYGSTDIATGDIVLGQMVTVVYDGTNFQMTSMLSTGFAAAKFGGTGADGALTISSGTTTLDIGSAKYLEKNYTSVSITGTAVLTFSNPHTDGSTIKIRCTGNFTVTSSTNPAVDLRGFGGAGVSGSGGVNGAAAEELEHSGGFCGAPYRTWWMVTDTPGFGGHGGGSASRGSRGTKTGTTSAMWDPTDGGMPSAPLTPWLTYLEPGGGGGAASGGHANGFTGGAGGNGSRGGASLDVEVVGNINITSVFNAAGTIGTNGAAGTLRGGGGGGGGGGGKIRILYNGSVTANSATFTVTGGAGGSGANGGGTGGAGSNGESLVAANTYFV